jgi:hypothetical protein
LEAGRSYGSPVGPCHDTPDVGKPVDVSRAGDDYERREVKIAMRDGVDLSTVIVVPKGAKGAPMLLTRTPYDAGRRTARAASPSMLATLPQGDEVFVADGYIRVFQAGPTSSPTRRLC